MGARLGSSQTVSTISGEPGEGTHTRVVQLWARVGGKGKWILAGVQLDTQAVCCTITSAFLRETGISEALPPFNDGHECKHESHLCRVRLSLSGGDQSQLVPFCVLQDEKAIAVMTGEEECWTGSTLHAPWAGFGIEPMTREQEERRRIIAQQDRQRAQSEKDAKIAKERPNKDKQSQQNGQQTKQSQQNGQQTKQA